MSASGPQALWLWVSQYSARLYLILQQHLLLALVMLTPSCWLLSVFCRSTASGPLSPWLASSSASVSVLAQALLFELRVVVEFEHTGLPSKAALPMTFWKNFGLAGLALELASTQRPHRLSSVCRRFQPC